MKNKRQFNSEMDYMNDMEIHAIGRRLVDNAVAQFGEHFDANRYAHFQYRLDVLTSGPNIEAALRLERCINKLLAAMQRGDSVAVDRLASEEKVLYEKYKIAIRQWRIKKFDCE